MQAFLARRHNIESSVAVEVGYCKVDACAGSYVWRTVVDYLLYETGSVPLEVVKAYVVIASRIVSVVSAISFACN